MFTENRAFRLGHEGRVGVCWKDSGILGGEKTVSKGEGAACGASCGGGEGGTGDEPSRTEAGPSPWGPRAPRMLILW